MKCADFDILNSVFIRLYASDEAPKSVHITGDRENSNLMRRSPEKQDDLEFTMRGIWKRDGFKLNM